MNQENNQGQKLEKENKPSVEGQDPQKNSNAFQPPQVNLPKGGGAIQGIGEKFQANPVTGTGSMSVPVAMSPGRGGFTPQLALSYDSGAGNSAFGLGWNIGLPSITRKTSKGLPEYNGLPKYYDAFESDVFILSGAEDLIPKLDEEGNPYSKIKGKYTVQRYIPRTEGLFARIEKWINNEDQSSYWQTISKENITTIYGQSEAAKITDPQKNWKVFQWKIERTFDNKGNVIYYEYKKEDGAGFSSLPIFEKNRNSENAYNQTYLKRVFYGNTIPYQSKDFINNKWLFELVLNYGEHTPRAATDFSSIPFYEEIQDWAVRPDIFSTFRSGFDIRTYRLCQSILMFHHFEEELGIPNYLVKATHLEQNKNTILSQIKSITHVGYQYDSTTKNYTFKSYPPVNFKYTAQKVDPKVYEIDSTDLPNAPQGIDGQQFQFSDLYGEGLNGILSQKGSAWYYKRNEGEAQFAPQKLVANIPSLAVNANVQIADIDGNGLTDVLIQSSSVNGFYELNEEEQWSNFKPFTHPVNFNINDSNIRTLDLDGNGIADLLITEDECFVWYPANAKDGYKKGRRVAKVLDEEQGPRIVFNERFQTIFLSDMSGDGLIDIVRIRNGEICYWANMGYGRFSHKITMANAPQFDYPDYFDPARIRLTDIDGSGSIDIIYLGREKIKYWLNESGNSWSSEKSILHFPKTNNLHSVSAFDLLGNGTACIVWSSPLPAEARTPMKYIKLMGNTHLEGNKPYLLKEVNNNMGSVTRMKYEASTKFYLDDRKKGNPWITKLPFPVQVLTRQEILDEITNTHFVTKWEYHHGYFDAKEREFRGFGRVDQWDTEDFDSFSEKTLFETPGQNWSKAIDIIPPVHTKTWFHNGYYKKGEKISGQYEKEYYQGDVDAPQLSDTELPENLTNEEKREAARTLRGSPLKVEVYGGDNSPDAIHPYTVTETKYHLKVIQRKGDQRHASFYKCACETLSFHYERNPNDPRITHQHTLAIDAFGNPLKSAAIVYPRRTTSVHPEQNKTYTTYTESEFINITEDPTFYKVGVPFAQRTFEFTGVQLTMPFDKEALNLAIAGATEIPYEVDPGTGLKKRLVNSTKSSFYNKDLTAELPFGEIAFHCLPYRTYEAVYTQGLIDKYKKDGNVLIHANQLETTGGFVSMEQYWWRPSGKALFDAAQFFQPIQQEDPFGQIYSMSYDAYHLAMIKTATKIYDKTISSEGQLNYRVLQPLLLIDPNGNQQEVIFDALGMVIATAVMGKKSAGDTLRGYVPVSFTKADLRSNILTHPHQYLQQATSFFHYDLYAWLRDGRPNHTVALVRETHVNDENGNANLPAGQLPQTQINFSYYDGLGQTLMIKAQAEPGNAFRIVNGQVTNDPAHPRWVGNGRTIFNNKGNPVKQYEPYFSASYDYESETELVEYGVTPILHYDPLGRNIRTDLPDGTFTKVEFTPWIQRTFDQVDTVLKSQWYQDRTAPNPTDPEPNVLNNPANYPIRAAWLAAQHSRTPKEECLDTLGRVFLLKDDNGPEGIYETRFKLDILGNQMEVRDALGRLISRNHFNLVQEPILTESFDAGKRWSLTNSMGNPIFAWNDRDFQTRWEYDALQRNTATYIKELNQSEQLVYFNVYGERLPNPEEYNHYGQIYQLYDQSGCKTNEPIDFKGNPIKAKQQVCIDYKNTIDWTALNGQSTTDDIENAASSLLEAEIFQTSTQYDALNRPTQTIAPDNTATIYQYNEANFIEKIQTRRIQNGNATTTAIVKNIDYDAKGQRTKIQYGNNISCQYEYDEKTFRLTRMTSIRSTDGKILQDLQYHYDPVGNITDLRDDAQQKLFFHNTVVEPHNSYTYDALYRLIKATGREHPGQNAAPGRTPRDFEASFPLPHANDGQVMRRYQRKYKFDALGNIQSIQHKAGNNGQSNWTRNYQYSEASQLESGIINNHLSQTNLTNPFATSKYTHDIHGNMTSMPHLPNMFWDFQDQLKEVELASGREFYTYTIGGGKDFGVRLRKVTEQNGKIKDRIYLGGFEVYRERTMANGVELERSTLHVEDDKGRIALVDHLIIENGQVASNNPLGIIRYQLSNHLGSATVEVDGAGQVICIEEYFAFGGSSYVAGRTEKEVQEKRYRYVGKERDESTGLDYYGARYYGSWIGRFVSVDALKDEYPFYTAYQYAGNMSVTFWDLDGKETADNTIINIEAKEPLLTTPPKKLLSDDDYLPYTLKEANLPVSQFAETPEGWGFAQLEEQVYLEIIFKEKIDQVLKDLKNEENKSKLDLILDLGEFKSKEQFFSIFENPEIIDFQLGNTIVGFINSSGKSEFAKDAAHGDTSIFRSKEDEFLKAKITIDINIIKLFTDESLNSTGKEFVNLLFESTILHEIVHFGDLQDIDYVKMVKLDPFGVRSGEIFGENSSQPAGWNIPYEIGKYFEKKAYGKDISIMQNKDVEKKIFEYMGF